MNFISKVKETTTCKTIYSENLYIKLQTDDATSEWLRISKLFESLFDEFFSWKTLQKVNNEVVCHYQINNGHIHIRVDNNFVTVDGSQW